MPIAGWSATLSERRREELASRAAGLAVALLVQLLLLLALLSLNRTIAPPPEARLTEVDLSAQDYADPAPTQPEPEQEQRRPADRPQPVQAATPTLQPAPAPEIVFPVPEAPVLPAPVERPAPPRPGVVIGPVQGPPSPAARSQGDSERVGSAPNGEPLYAARWYREPSDDELRGYLSTATGPGWGLIACRTAPDYRVEDCVPLAEYPTGSMINRAVLAAAWQFRVRPPRLGGRNMVGSWVRIRIDYTVRRD